MARVDQAFNVDAFPEDPRAAWGAGRTGLFVERADFTGGPAEPGQVRRAHRRREHLGRGAAARGRGPARAGSAAGGPPAAGGAGGDDVAPGDAAGAGPGGHPTLRRRRPGGAPGLLPGRGRVGGRGAAVRRACRRPPHPGAERLGLPADALATVALGPGAGGRPWVLGATVT
ncbi:MAG: hypothetical protein R3F43_13345 [bacterium]